MAPNATVRTIVRKQGGNPAATPGDGGADRRRIAVCYRFCVRISNRPTASVSRRSGRTSRRRLTKGQHASRIRPISPTAILPRFQMRITELQMTFSAYRMRTVRSTQRHCRLILIIVIPRQRLASRRRRRPAYCFIAVPAMRRTGPTARLGITPTARRLDAYAGSIVPIPYIRRS